MRIYLYVANRNIQEPWPHDLYFMVWYFTDFGQFSMAKSFVIGASRFLSSVDGSKLILGALPLRDQQGLLSIQGFMLRGGARGQYLGHRIFCLMSWKLVDGWILYLRCWFSVTQTLTLIYVYMSVTYISWPSDFASYLEDYLLDKCHNWDIGSMCCKDLPH